MVLILNLDDGGGGDLGDHSEPATKPVGADNTSSLGQDLYGLPPPPYSTIPTTHYGRLDFNCSWRVVGEVHGSERSQGHSASPPPSFAESAVESSTGLAENASAEYPPPMIAQLFTAYPIVISVVSHLDQTDLNSLVRTCRIVRANLSQFRSQALSHTLRCVNESTPRDPTTAAPPRWFPPCARDLVAPCRRCTTAVCRNCIAKPARGLRPSNRFRRLCKTCQAAPLNRMGVGREGQSGNDDWAPCHVRGLCECASAGVHICRGCDHGQTGKDMTYSRVWNWRDRYRNLGFGLGTGVGEGNEGVKCGRGAACLAARDLIVDIDGAEALASSGAQVLGPAGGGSPTLGGFSPVERSPISTPSSIFIGSSTADAGASSSNRPAGYFTIPLLWSSSTAGSPPPLPSPSLSDQQSQSGQHEDAAGYYRQEVEGIGGVVKKKLKKRVRVGATVTEYEDESQTGVFLERERSNVSRSWCAWCDRVVPSLTDLDVIKGHLAA